MAGGQPVSLRNLRAVRALTEEYDVPFFLDATRISENTVFVKDREPRYAGWPLPDLIREIARWSDGAVFSSKKDHFVPIGGFLALNDDGLAERARELAVVYEGFPRTTTGSRGTTWRLSHRGSRSRPTRRSCATTSGRSRF